MKENIPLKYLLAFLLITISNVSMAWGTIGHKTIAYIAQDNLTEKAKKNILDLLALENRKNLVEIALWADKNRRPDLPYHTVRIPLSQKSYDEQRDCFTRKRICIVKGLQEQISILEEPLYPPSRRLEALKLVVHFLGDIHQPLHASNLTGTVAILSGERLTMHKLWDTKIVNRFGMNYRKLAKYLEIDMPDISQGTPIDWANESHEIAIQYFKPLLNENSSEKPIALSEDYMETIEPVVRLRLQKAGIRLGRLLNSIFDH